MVYIVSWYIGDSSIPRRKYYQRLHYALRWKKLMEDKGYLAYFFEIPLDKWATI